MGKKETFLLLRLTFPKVRMFNRQLKWSLVIIAIGSVALFVVYDVGLSNMCPIRQLSIADEIKKYDETQDPLTCDKLNMKIYELNSQCTLDVEELDCG